MLEREKMDYYVKRIGQNRGAPRIYLDGQAAVRAGFSPGDRFDIKMEEGKGITLTVNKDGSRTVSSKKKGDKTYPVIDINSAELLKVFEGMDSVRMIVKGGKVVFVPLASELHKRDRLANLVSKIHRAENLTIGSLSHGGGVMCHAIHEGLKAAGIKADLLFANDIREDLIAQAAEYNDAWGDNTSAIAAPMQEIVQDEWLMNNLPKLNILDMSLPCSGASKAGVAKRGLEKMEDHPEVGHLVFAALVIINKTQPAVLLLENVVPYASSASAQILRHQLSDMGYNVHEAVLNGKDWGCLEHRERWCLVATTAGLDFDFDQIAPAVTVVKKLGDVLEQIPDDDPRWSEMRGLKDKERRDMESGKGFKMQVFGSDSTKISTLTKGYAKVRSTDPKILNENDPDKLRQLTAREHAAIKNVPAVLIEGLSETTAHELLGQSVVYDPFKSVGQRIGEAVQKYIADAADKQNERTTPTVRRSIRATG